jgi:hypothetical protein
MTTEEKTVETIDLTPTWSEILTALLAVIVNGETFEARNTAHAELRRMARLADALKPALDALRAFQRAGVGQSTDFAVQAEAHKLLIAALDAAAKGGRS